MSVGNRPLPGMDRIPGLSQMPGFNGSPMNPVASALQMPQQKNVMQPSQGVTPKSVMPGVTPQGAIDSPGMSGPQVMQRPAMPSSPFGGMSPFGGGAFGRLWGNFR